MAVVARDNTCCTDSVPKLEYQSRHLFSDPIKFDKDIQQISVFDNIVLDLLFAFALWNDSRFCLKQSAKNAANWVWFRGHFKEMDIAEQH